MEVKSLSVGSTGLLLQSLFGLRVVDSQKVRHVNKIKRGNTFMNFLDLIPQYFATWNTVMVVDVIVTSLFLEIFSKLQLF